MADEPKNKQVGFEELVRHDLKRLGDEIIALQLEVAKIGDKVFDRK